MVFTFKSVSLKQNIADAFLLGDLYEGNKDLVRLRTSPAPPVAELYGPESSLSPELHGPESSVSPGGAVSGMEQEDLGNCHLVRPFLVRPVVAIGRNVFDSRNMVVSKSLTALATLSKRFLKTLLPSIDFISNKNGQRRILVFIGCL